MEDNKYNTYENTFIPLLTAEVNLENSNILVLTEKQCRKTHNLSQRAHAER